MIIVKRIYEPQDAGDGHRVLVDRLCPRGISREAAGIDSWTKDIAPSSELRKWYGHEPKRWDEFQVRYRQELANPALQLQLANLRQIADRGNLTLLTATRAQGQSHVTVIAEELATRGSTVDQRSRKALSK